MDSLNYPSSNDLQKALSSFILSASGWRKVFALQGEDSSNSEVALNDQVLAALMAKTFGEFIKSKNIGSRPIRILVGRDSRPTGEVLEPIMIKGFLTLDIEVDTLGVSGVAELMAYVQLSQKYQGFCYISASHNPIGHNGVKFGLGSGGVLGGQMSKDLIAQFKSSVENYSESKDFWSKHRSLDFRLLENVQTKTDANRLMSKKAYWSLAQSIFTGKDLESLREKEWGILKTQFLQSKIGVVAEYNGSARANGIDRQWLEELGVTVNVLNDQPGHFVHPIIPEGCSLDLCRQILEKLHENDSKFSLGFVPDCDGDRGNLVYFDDREKKAKILQAQEVFSLCVLSELAGLVPEIESGYKVGVVCNDPTSLRVEAIAQAFGAQVFRVEVGEANVVNRAQELREDGWIIRIFGEGSNGGNITYPGKVRDPLSTLGSLLKLLCLRGNHERAGLFEVWCKKTNQPYLPDFTLAQIIDTLPSFTTTEVTDPRALLKIKSLNPAEFKKNYEEFFLKNGWPTFQNTLGQKYGVVQWEIINYEGTKETPGLGAQFRSGKQTGGLKILLKGTQNKVLGFVWMRPSGTEPVFRIMADWQGSDALVEQELLAWQSKMIQAADR